MGAIDYIDVKRTTISMLKDWYDQRWKLDNSPAKIAEINDRMTSVKSASGNPTPVQGGANQMEDRLCKSIDQKAVAMHGLKKAREYEWDISMCWQRLTEEERFCLTARFIDHEEGNGIAKIMNRLNVEKSEAYNRSNAALERLSKLLFW